MTSYVIPAALVAGDSGHVVVHADILGDLVLIAGIVPAVSGGLSGATAAARWAGATTSGAPVAGTFTTGDWITDHGGNIWICTAGGTPGTWGQVGAGGGGAMTNPMTTAQDLIVGGGGGTPGRLGIGSNGQALIVAAGAAAWGAVGFTGGGTGQVTQQAALDALAAAVTSGQFLRGNGTHVAMAAITTADVPQLADYAPSGLTGATAASRYVGATTSGAPVTGTFTTGDWIVDQAGHVWICTAGGTSGTWANAGSSSGVSAFNSRSGPVTPGNADYLAVASGGLSGATAGARLVGGTTSGAPASGTFVAGDLDVDHSGNIWICTAGGSPGTWVQPGSVYAPLAGATFTGYTAPAVVPLTFGSSIAVNAALGNDFRVTLTSSAGTVANPSNPVDGQVIEFQVTQDGTGSRTLAWGSAFNFGAAGTPALSTTASKTDIVGFKYNATKTQWLYLGAMLGY